MEKIFSYGTLQQEDVQLSIFGRLLHGIKDTLIGYKLSEVKITDQRVIEASGTDIHPILKYTGDESALVRGTVFEISENELAQADAYEVDDYKRVSATLKSGHKAWIYAAAES